MAGRCKGSTIFMNVVRPCEDDAYDAEGYCKTHLVLMQRSTIAEQQAEIERIKKSHSMLRRAVWHNMIDADMGGTEDKLVERFLNIWLPQQPEAEQ